MIKKIILIMAVVLSLVMFGFNLYLATPITHVHYVASGVAILMALRFIWTVLKIS